MSILSKATAHYRERISGGFQSIEVPEWGTEIFFKPSISLKEQAPISRLLSQGKSEEALVETLIIRCHDADGKRVFRMADKHELMNKVDPSVVARIVEAINAREDDPDPIDTAGNG